MATNKPCIEIPNRFKSLNNSEDPAIAHIVAGADDIYDDDKAKKQSVVNQETDTALANRYTKDETYSKNELNNLITTPNQQYVSVTATDQTTAVTDVLPAEGSADTVYRVGNWDGTQYDDTVYSEYAWNGTSYVHLSTKTLIGEVFDISAYHATGGTLATYADLAAALGANGANVPESLRKGGMSIKFVQSIDNKYVQFRYMSSSTAVADFTNAANWQGVDDEPVAQSKNLVESGGVYESEQKIYKEYLKLPFNSQGYINNNGTISGASDVSNYRTNLVSVSEGDVFIYSGVGVSGINGLVWGYSSESLENAQVLVQSTISAITRTEFTIPSGVSFIIAWSRETTLRELFKKSSYEERISEIEPIQSLGNSTTKTLSQNVISKQLIAKDNGITKDLTTDFRSSGILECKLWTTKSDYLEEVEVGITYLGIQNNVFYFFFNYDGSQKQLSQSAAGLSAGKHTFVFTEISISGLATVFAKVTIDTNIFVRYSKTEGDELYTLLRKVDNESNLEFGNYVTKSDIPNIQTPCIEYSDSLVYSKNVPYKLIHTSRSNVNGITYMANNTPAPYSGIITKIKFISPAGKPFTVSTAKALDSNNFKFTRTKTVTPSTTGMQELVINLPISEGEFVFYGQDGTDTQQFPGYTTNASVVSDNGGKTYWLKSNPTIGQSYYCGPDTSFVCNAVYTISKYKFQEAGTTPDRKINYITATRNADNFNSIRELMANITDATEYNQYVIVVPDGEWFECDLKGKKYVRIKGQSKNGTIIYCDGNSSNVTPSDYTYSSYQNTPLNEIPKIDKHIVFLSDDLLCENITFRAEHCKYVVHGDNVLWNTASFFNCVFTGQDLNTILGFGLSATQKFVAENCEFKTLSGSIPAIYYHNWYWQKTVAKNIPLFGGGSAVVVKNCTFSNNERIALIGEIASMNDDMLIIENCYLASANEKAITYYVEKENGVPLAKDLNGNRIQDALDVPYCIQINIIKSGEIRVNGGADRPNCSNMVTNVL